MSSLPSLLSAARSPRRSAAWLYLRRFLAHPLRIASFVASSRALGRLVAAQVRCGEGEWVLELGAGTGAVTRALLEAGLPAERLLAVEIDAQMAGYLQETCPQVRVLCSDAFALEEALPPGAAGAIGTVICGLPVSLMPRERQAELVAGMQALTPPGRRFLAYSHRLTSPLPAARLGLEAERLAFTLQNLPPASVWGYRARGGEER